MKPERNAWAFLRPLLLALAAAASWIALSAAGASADSSASSDSLLGAGTTTLISAPATVEDVTGLVNQVVTAPLVEELVPEGAVAAAVDPAAGIVDGVFDGAVGTLVPLAGAVLEPLDPVLEPVVSAAPLPVAAPEGEPEGNPLPVTEGPVVGDETAAHQAESGAESAGAVPGSARSVRHDTLLSDSPPRDPSVKPTAVTPLLPTAGPEDPVDAPPHAPSDPLPAMVDSATGGSSPSGGNGPTMPAWLTSHNLRIPAAGAAAVQDGSPTVPAPGSFDPGSSPD
ncbi:hypothetical protein [Pseudarthrobacter sp. BRE9]|uniref:hypothetical protein n=1 Tax=Pseudarthrobacter sp. BRE9 TaxID=2962582 RepID=UPI00288290F0|nr:hypothetical protein [Pseudarthrobacter sp. BRE9]MDT0169221.1 hypothetical protein [Pseudarthrobacter sp. BRE9]